MSELIWISDWQIQCCGPEFAVADEVTWPVFPYEGSRDNWGSGITGTYDRHEDEPWPMVSGVVRRIRAVSLRGPSGTEVVEDVTDIERWYGTDFDNTVLRFCGWLVDLEVPS